MINENNNENNKKDFSFMTVSAVGKFKKIDDIIDYYLSINYRKSYNWTFRGYADIGNDILKYMKNGIKYLLKTKNQTDFDNKFFNICDRVQKESEKLLKGVAGARISNIEAGTTQYVINMTMKCLYYYNFLEDKKLIKNFDFKLCHFILSTDNLIWLAEKKIIDNSLRNATRMNMNYDSYMNIQKAIREYCSQIHYPKKIGQCEKTIVETTKVLIPPFYLEILCWDKVF